MRDYSPLPALSLCAAALLASCGPPPAPGRIELPRPKPNFYMRTGFDDDPSPYIGRFIPDSATPNTIDDAASRKTECSQYYSIRRVGGGGVTFDEYFAASNAAAAGLNVPTDLPLRAGASGGTGQVLRVQYTLTGKWIGDVSDPAAYARCCAEADGRCTQRVIGEFLEGTGRIYRATVSHTEGGASTPAAGVEFRDGMYWRETVEFQNPIFFAFKLTPGRPERANSPAGGACPPEWARRPPRVAHGTYFVGVSEWIDSEQRARDEAMLHARRQLIRFLGQFIRENSERGESTRGQAGKLASTVEQTTNLDLAAQALTRFVKDEDWCLESTQGPDRWQYRAYVLAFLSNEARQPAADAIVSLER